MLKPSSGVGSTPAIVRELICFDGGDHWDCIAEADLEQESAVSRKLLEENELAVWDEVSHHRGEGMGESMNWLKNTSQGSMPWSASCQSESLGFAKWWKSAWSVQISRSFFRPVLSLRPKP